MKRDCGSSTSSNNLSARPILLIGSILDVVPDVTLSTPGDGGGGGGGDGGWWMAVCV